MTDRSSQIQTKTSTFTLRIDNQTFTSLQTESDTQDITLNALINKILKRYAEWDRYEPKIDMIPMAKSVIRSLFNLISEDEISYLVANFGKNIIQDISFMKMGLDTDSFLIWLENRMKRSFVEFNSAQENDQFKCVLKHDMGLNWSIYHKKILEQIFNKVFNKRIDIAISEFILTFR